MNDKLKETLIEMIWNFWYENEVSWEEIFVFLSTNFPKTVLLRLNNYVKDDIRD